MLFKGVKGFTLFTALLSFILIVLATLFISNMILTSRTTSDIITSIEEQSRMQAIADLARADAIQAFNYNIRWKFENHFLRPDNPLDLVFFDETGGVREWEELKDEFARDFFADPATGRSQFAGIMTKNIENILENPPKIKGYLVSLVNRGETSAERIKLETALTNVFFRSVEEEDFFLIVGCENGDIQDCDQGTFYVNLKLDRISDEDYENLPQIRVENPATGRVIREPLLPRTTFRIYVPSRIFRAIAFARDLAADPDMVGMKNQLKQAGLGMCDNICLPRNWLYPNNTIPTSQNTLLCPRDTFSSVRVPQVGGSLTLTQRNIPFPPTYAALYGAQSSYDPGTGSRLPAFENIVGNMVWQKARTKMNGWNLGDMELIGGDKYADPNNQARIYRLDLEEAFLPSATVTPYDGAQAKPAGNSPTYQLYCNKIKSIQTIVALKEKNPAYIINKDNYDNPAAAYKIRIYDIYSPTITQFNCKSVTTITGATTGLPTPGIGGGGGTSANYKCIPGS
jgi:hypothetical protein